MQATFNLKPKRRVLQAGALLVSAIISLSAHAQTAQPGGEPIIRVSDDWSTPAAAAACNNGACGDQAVRPGNSRAITSSLSPARTNILPDVPPSPARNWKDHLVSRANGETYECLLSFAIGGELKSGGGTLGTALLGRTQTLNRPR